MTCGMTRAILCSLLCTPPTPAWALDKLVRNYSQGCQCDGITANREQSEAFSSSCRTLSWNGFSSVYPSFCDVHSFSSSTLYTSRSCRRASEAGDGHHAQETCWQTHFYPGHCRGRSIRCAGGGNHGCRRRRCKEVVNKGTRLRKQVPGRNG